MALTKCKECGTEISDKAGKCPKCGAPVKKGGVSVIAIVVATFGILIVFSMISREFKTDTPPKKPKTSEQGSVSAAAETKPAMSEQTPILITAEDLYKEYEANEIAADRKYKGKLLKISGTIRDIGKTLGEPHINLATGKFSNQVIVYFPDKKYDDRLAQYSTGDNIEVTGTCKGETLGMVVISLK